MKKTADGFLEKITLGGKDYHFNSKGPALYGIDGNDIEGVIDVAEYDDYAVISVEIKNNGNTDFYSEHVGVYLGIDCYMEKFPDWNEKLFPTMLRFEKTHFYGYFMSPQGDILGIASPQPFASYKFLYNGSGHRIDSVTLDIISSLPQPARYTQNLNMLRAGERISRKIYLFPLKNLNELSVKSMHFTGAAIVEAVKYTCEKGERLNILRDVDTRITVYSPDGQKADENAPLSEYGVYTVIAERNGKISETYVYCRKDWEFYLKSARKEAVNKPQKATTHCESWYGLFSGYLAGRHYPDVELDTLIEDKFCEIMPYMFDFEKGEPLLLPGRIQNISSAISLLVDRYESNPDKYKDSLDIADRLADFLICAQRRDGAFYGGYEPEGVHYTCVIYIAKSLLELFLVTSKLPGCEERSIKYYAVVKAAVDNLVEKLDDIGTEGEQTFEDGMISCSALQIGMFALTLAQEERQPYINAAECLMEKHSCLEQNKIPDCRMRGSSLRYWEAQYDVLTKPNMMNSPHGWTAWTLYAKYYLYLLTGKEKYLTGLMDGMGACAQLMELNGNLRWGFICDPCIDAELFIKDKKIVNGYSGTYTNKNIGEQYMDMISDWFTHEKQRVTGGFPEHPLMTKDESMDVDNQGGCCDNDVHEIFKCMEETVLKKAFIHEKENGEYLCYGCRIENGKCCLNEPAEVLIYRKRGKDSPPVIQKLM